MEGGFCGMRCEKFPSWCKEWKWRIMKKRGVGEVGNKKEKKNLKM